jgi:L-cysteine:1D-myo-inositol 2-amino-2-deoxy-alpha-D-glucopyranoside ligase
MQLLNVRPPDWYPRATEMIPEIIQFVEKLLVAGVAYISGSNVYFDVNSWSDFGKLCHLPKEEMLPVANERGNHPDDPHKRHPIDFVLWQAQVPGEPAWESPWGPGRPGWHIECSTMSTNLLGEVVDIHSGGADLCFPHHECEIAQVEPVTGEKPFVRYWMHVAMVRYQGEKMSKSLGNLIWVRELLKTYTADGIRLYLAGYHYRDSWSYDEDELKHAEQLASLIRLAVSLQGGEADPLDSAAAWSAFLEAMDDDLDTPSARQVLETLAGKIVDAAAAGRDVHEAQASLREMGLVFGLRIDAAEPEQRVMDGWEEHLKKFL